MAALTVERAAGATIPPGPTITIFFVRIAGLEEVSYSLIRNESLQETFAIFEVHRWDEHSPRSRLRHDSGDSAKLALGIS